jgi:hypothetical protein
MRTLTVTLTVAAALAAAPAAARADTIALSVGPDPVEDTGFPVTATGQGSDGANLYATIEPARGAGCATTYPGPIRDNSPFASSRARTATTPSPAPLRSTTPAATSSAPGCSSPATPRSPTRARGRWSTCARHGPAHASAVPGGCATAARRSSASPAVASSRAGSKSTSTPSAAAAAAPPPSSAARRCCSPADGRRLQAQRSGATPRHRPPRPLPALRVGARRRPRSAARSRGQLHIPRHGPALMFTAGGEGVHTAVRTPPRKARRGGWREPHTSLFASAIRPPSPLAPATAHPAYLEPYPVARHVNGSAGGRRPWPPTRGPLAAAGASEPATPAGAGPIDAQYAPGAPLLALR